MSGFLRTVGTVGAIAGSLALAAGTLGVGSIATAGLLTSIGTKVALAASVISAAGAASAKKPVNERQGAQLQFKIDPGSPLSYVMGRTAVGGTLVHRETYGTDNSYQTWFVDLGAGGPYDAIEQFTADRAEVPLSGTSALGYYANWLWQDQQLGQTPEPRALTNGIGRPPYGQAGQVPGWSDAHRMSGHAAASVSFLYDTKARRYAQGEPKPGWVLRGAKVYDPAQDSTYPGGSGPCRWADPSDTVAHAAARATWVYSDSPALHGLMWRLGIWQRDETDPNARYQKIMGIGAPIDLIDLPAIVHAHNIQVANGWQVSGEVTSAQDKWEVLKLIEQAGGCEPISVGALMSTLIKAPRVPLRTITATDLADGTLSAPAMRARSERINGYRARFRSEPHGWEMTSIDIVQVPTYVAEDGRAKTGSGDFSLVTDPDQCAELAAYEVFDSREIEPIVVPLKPFAVAYRLGDCLTLDLPEIGLEAREAVVRGRSVDPATGIVTLTLRSETAGKHPACLGQTGDTPPTPTLTAPPDSIAAPAEGAWSVQAGTGTAAGLTVPALIVTGRVDNSNADGVLIEWQRVGDAQWQSAGLLAPDTQARTIAPVDADTAYRVAIRYRGRGIYSLARIIGPVTTGAASADWKTGIVGPEKPDDYADVTAENTAKDTAAVGGVPTPIVIQVLDRVPQLAAGQQLLERSVLDLDGFSRRIDQQKAVLEATLLRVIGEAGYQRSVMRDAGVVIDAATGKVTLYALDQTRDQLANALIQLDATKAQIVTKVDASFVRAEIAAAQLNPEDLAALEGVIARVTSAEQRLDGLAARLETKAEAATLTALSGTVQSAVQTLDALAGEVATKVSFTEFNRATTRLGVVEQQLVAIGDVASFTITVQQAKAVGDAALFADIAGLAAADQAARRQIVAAAEARQELVTRMDAGDAVSAAATLFLTAKLGETDARAAAETLVRAGQTSALAQQTSALSAMIGSLSATVTAQAQALVDERGARVEDGRQIRAEFDPRITAAAGRAEEAAAAAGRVDGRVTAEASRVDRAIADAAAASASATQQVRAELDPRITAAAKAGADADTRAGEAAAAAGRADTKAADAAAAAGRVNDRVSAQVTRLDQADADERGARAAAVEQVRVEAAGKVAVVDDRVTAVVDRTGKIEATRTIAIDSNGNIVGQRLVGSPEGPGALELINADLKMGTGRLIFNTGTVMLVGGLGFGAARDLILWFGPTMALDRCTRANGTFWLGTEAAAYFGGGLTAGTLRNGAVSSGVGNSETAEVGPFGSNGRPIRYIAAWSLRTEFTKTYTADQAGMEQYEADRQTFNSADGRFGTRTATNPKSTITLTRSFDGKTYDQLSSREFTVETQTWRAVPPTPGDAPGSATFTADIGGGFTVNDPTQSAANRWLRLTLARGYPVTPDQAVQRLSIVAIEE